MKKNWKIRLSGTGGQGVIKGAVILAEAALIDGSNASQSQSYGPESRGGSTRAEVNISQQQILYPKVEEPDLLLCMSPQAYDKYVNDLIPGGLLFLDGDIGADIKRNDVAVYRCGITELTRDVFKSEQSANIVALGVINGVTDMVSETAMHESLRRNFKSKVAEINIKAYAIGYEAGKKLLSADK